MDEKSLLTRGLHRFPVLLLALGLVACAFKEPPDSTSKWLPSQVRGLDPAESTPNPIAQIDPSQDLIALYTRESDRDLQIRLDLLELELAPAFGLASTPPFDLYLEFDLSPDEAQNHRDVWIRVPAGGQPSVSSSTSQTKPRITYDTSLDSITVSLTNDSLPSLQRGYFIRAYITPPGSDQRLDEIPWVSSENIVEPVPLLLAFWNTMPAHTPAQALRRWNGAHTGPEGERHGLKHLLGASLDNQIPIALLDLKTPASLTSLDALEQSAQIAEMLEQGLLILPDALPIPYFGSLPDWAISQAASTSQQKGAAFGLPESPFLYAPAPLKLAPAAYSLALVRQPATSGNGLPTTQVIPWQTLRMLPLPMDESPDHQPMDQGLSLSTRRALLELALDLGSRKEIVLFGGNLPLTTWGDPQAAEAAMHYLAGHPWLHVLDTDELLSILPCEDRNCPQSPANTDLVIKHPVMAALENAPPGMARELAWQMFLDLSAPATPAGSELAELRSQYLGEIGNLLAAAGWESNTPSTNPNLTTRNAVEVNCTSDTDYDGHPECILSDERSFALLDLEGGRLVLLFGRDSGEVVELIGPISQFVVGLSDYRQWNLSAGPLADPANIPGAFSGPWVDYQIEILDDGIRFFAPGAEKSFRLTENGLRVEIQTEQTQEYLIPLAVAPETRFTPGWVLQYQKLEIPQGWIWGIGKGTKVEIRSSGSFSTQNFQESQSFLAYPENPNRDYVPGHFLPFPIGLVTIPAQGEFWVEISWFATPPPDR